MANSNRRPPPAQTQPAQQVQPHGLNPFATANRGLVQSGGTVEQGERAVAEVQAALVVAKRFPRNQAQAMDRVLMSCARPGLAATAVYEYARGGQAISGPSIRLAEELSRQWGNMTTGVYEVARRDGESECLAFAWDLEANTRDERRFIVKHWRDTRTGGYALTDERDIYELIANQGARRKRAAILAMIPGDVQEAAVQQCEQTLKASADTSPEAMKRLVEAFAPFGVVKGQIEQLIQRKMAAITAAQVMRLRRIYQSLKDGMGEVADYFQPLEEDGADPEPKTKPEHRRHTASAKPATEAPQPTQETAAAGDYSEVPVAEIVGKLTRAGVTQQAFCETFGILNVADLPLPRVLDAMAWIDEVSADVPE